MRFILPPLLSTSAFAHVLLPLPGKPFKIVTFGILADNVDRKAAVLADYEFRFLYEDGVDRLGIRNTFGVIGHGDRIGNLFGILFFDGYVATSAPIADEFHTWDYLAKL